MNTTPIVTVSNPDASYPYIYFNVPAMRLLKNTRWVKYYFDTDFLVVSPERVDGRNTFTLSKASHGKGGKTTFPSELKTRLRPGHYRLIPAIAASRPLEFQLDVCGYVFFMRLNKPMEE